MMMLTLKCRELCLSPCEWRLEVQSESSFGLGPLLSPYSTSSSARKWKATWLRNSFHSTDFKMEIALTSNGQLVPFQGQCLTLIYNHTIFIIQAGGRGLYIII